MSVDSSAALHCISKLHDSPNQPNEISMLSRACFPSSQLAASRVDSAPDTAARQGGQPLPLIDCDESGQID
jgi:hypothetical protein